jgi:hypothetical protein
MRIAVGMIAGDAWCGASCSPFALTRRRISAKLRERFTPAA